MKRQKVWQYTETGRAYAGWFDIDTATRYRGPRGSRRSEDLYLTVKDRYVRHVKATSRAGGSSTAEETWTYVIADDAREWLRRHGHSEAAEAVQDDDGTVPIPKQGKPRVGDPVRVRVPDAIVQRLDEVAPAGRRGVGRRAAWVRDAVQARIDQGSGFTPPQVPSGGGRSMAFNVRDDQLEVIDAESSTRSRWVLEAIVARLERDEFGPEGHEPRTSPPTPTTNG